MALEKFALGIDYGTESGRVVVVKVRNGEEIASTIVPYPDGVIDHELPGGRALAPDWALQNPSDYLTVVEKGVPRALKAAGAKGESVIGLGTDFTATFVIQQHVQTLTCIQRMVMITFRAHLQIALQVGVIQYGFTFRALAPQPLRYR